MSYSRNSEISLHNKPRINLTLKNKGIQFMDEDKSVKINKISVSNIFENSYKNKIFEYKNLINSPRVIPLNEKLFKKFYFQSKRNQSNDIKEYFNSYLKKEFPNLKNLASCSSISNKKRKNILFLRNDNDSLQKSFYNYFLKIKTPPNKFRNLYLKTKNNTQNYSEDKCKSLEKSFEKNKIVFNNIITNSKSNPLKKKSHLFNIKTVLIREKEPEKEDIDIDKMGDVEKLFRHKYIKSQTIKNALKKSDKKICFRGSLNLHFPIISPRRFNICNK